MLTDLKRARLRAPVVAVGDDALGFRTAVRDVWPKTRAQRDRVSKLGDILDKLPRRHQPRVKAALRMGKGGAGDLAGVLPLIGEAVSVGPTGADDDRTGETGERLGRALEVPRVEHRVLARRDVVARVDRPLAAQGHWRRERRARDTGAQPLRHVGRACLRAAGNTTVRERSAVDVAFLLLERHLDERRDVGRANVGAGAVLTAGVPLDGARRRADAVAVTLLRRGLDDAVATVIGIEGRGRAPGRGGRGRAGARNRRAGRRGAAVQPARLTATRAGARAATLCRTARRRGDLADGRMPRCRPTAGDAARPPAGRMDGTATKGRRARRGERAVPNEVRHDAYRTRGEVTVAAGAARAAGVHCLSRRERGSRIAAWARPGAGREGEPGDQPECTTAPRAAYHRQISKRCSSAPHVPGPSPPR